MWNLKSYDAIERKYNLSLDKVYSKYRSYFRKKLDEFQDIDRIPIPSKGITTPAYTYQVGLPSPYGILLNTLTLSNSPAFNSMPPNETYYYKDRNIIQSPGDPIAYEYKITYGNSYFSPLGGSSQCGIGIAWFNFSNIQTTIIPTSFYTNGIYLHRNGAVILNGVQVYSFGYIDCYVFGFQIGFREINNEFYMRLNNNPWVLVASNVASAISNPTMRYITYFANSTISGSYFTTTISPI